MNPYDRFRLIPIILATIALTLGLLIGWPVASAWLAEILPMTAPWLLVLAMAVVLVTLWAFLAFVFFPFCLHFPGLRRQVLAGKFVEGTWIEAVRGGKNGPRLAVVTIRPKGNGIALAATTLLRSGESERTLRMVHGQFDGQFLSYAYDDALPANGESPAGGLGEIQFETTGGAPVRYTGGRNGLNGSHLATEAIKLTRWRERRKLGRASTRAEIAGKYWSHFFETQPIVGRKTLDERETPDVRTFRKGDNTPTADRIRSQAAPAAVSSKLS